MPGFFKFFKKASDEEREHAEKFMKYQNLRGGRIVLQQIAKPTHDEWSSPLEAVTAALELEKTVNQVGGQVSLKKKGSPVFNKYELMPFLVVHVHLDLVEPA